eukprot:4681198-Amphidinium_carterae.1
MSLATAAWFPAVLAVVRALEKCRPHSLAIADLKGVEERTRIALTPQTQARQTQQTVDESCMSQNWFHWKLRRERPEVWPRVRHEAELPPELPAEVLPKSPFEVGRHPR